ncbi:hypothetical protein BFQ30_05370 [Haemophilus quentini]|uniref:Transposase n=1 Tax=Haemophilus quentini TaxID=123834 RepID=A0ABX3BSD5_9PAST|nr:MULTISPECIES: hypothetical protein [Haemophilus]NYA48827.1 hypothetical protein [Haemophilus haemolyticus]OEY77128.1 hypothetical protein BFQ29_05430 [Haemophilus quentini]OEY77854.1 hypothetical protein BFQ30_05370 [Haemophilus quentini]ORC35286.1 hypothetical protein BES36_007870 [Haemophilus quentini]
MSKDAKILMQQIEQLKQEIDLLKKENERLRIQADFGLERKMKVNQRLISQKKEINKKENNEPTKIPR